MKPNRTKRYYIKNIDADNIDVCNHLLKMNMRFSLVRDTFIVKDSFDKENDLKAMIKEFLNKGKTIILSFN